MKPKVGDIVFQTKNSVWLGPMKVVKLSNSGKYASCIHPKHGKGAFNFMDLTVISNKVSKKLNALYGGKFDNKN